MREYPKNSERESMLSQISDPEQRRRVEEKLREIDKKCEAAELEQVRQIVNGPCEEP